MKVAVSVHGRFHAFQLAGELFRDGLLAQLITTYPAVIARRFLPAGVPLATAPMLELARRFHDRFGGRAPDHLIASRFGAFAARRLAPEADVLVGWSSASVEPAREARRRGMAVVIERGSTHIVHQNAVLAEAHARFGLPFAGIDPRMIARELEEYALADRIVTGSTFAAETFHRQGIDPGKVVVNPYGVDLGRFARLSPQRGDGPLRILFVGQVGLRKGVPWLLDAFARLDAPAELHLVGPIEPAFRPLLGRLPLERVHLRGPLRGEDLERAYAQADLFCLPSIEEGLAMVLLEAMAAGLPVLATTATGIAVVAGAQPYLVPHGDADALADGLRHLAADAGRRAAMAEAGRRAVAAGFTWGDYGRRAIALYRDIRATC